MFNVPHNLTSDSFRTYALASVVAAWIGEQLYLVKSRDMVGYTTLPTRPDKVLVYSPKDGLTFLSLRAEKQRSE